MYAKPMGGIYNFANSAHLNDGRDTLIYSGLSADSNYIIFGRLEYLSGLKLEYTPSSYFSVYAGAGVTLFNWMGFASYQQNREKLERIKPFASEPLEGARGFIQFGLTLRLGKTKKMAGNTQMYEVFHLNNTFDPGDNNSDPGGGNNPVNRKEKDIKRLSYKDIEDLVEDGEF